MTTTPLAQIILSTPFRALALAAFAVLASCSSGEDNTAAISSTSAAPATTSAEPVTTTTSVDESSTVPADASTETTKDDDSTGESVGSTLVTPCFALATEFELPDTHIAADVSPDEQTCWFITQRPELADSTVIAGELWVSSGGQSFEEFQSFIEEGLAVGQEPDLLPLQVLNTGASGRNLPVTEKLEIDSPNRAVIWFHESDRRDGFTAMSAAVDFPPEEADRTRVIFMWGLVTDTNRELLPDLISAMEFDESFSTR